jgi:hypothetical protein
VLLGVDSGVDEPFDVRLALKDAFEQRVRYCLPTACEAEVLQDERAEGRHVRRMDRPVGEAIANRRLEAMALRGRAVCQWCQ